MRQYLDERDDLQAGRKPRSYNQIRCRLADLCNEFLTTKENRMSSGELSPLTFQDYHRTCKRVIAAFGGDRLVSDLDARDFENFRASLAKSLNPTTIGDVVRRSRMICKFAYDNGLIDKPIRYGQSFQVPSKRTLRRVRQEQQQKHGYRMFEACEIRRRGAILLPLVSVGCCNRSTSSGKGSTFTR